MLFTSKFTPTTTGKCISVSEKGINWIVDMLYTPYDAATFVAMQNSTLRPISQMLKPTGELTLLGKKWNNETEAFIATGDDSPSEVYFHGFHIWEDRREMITVIWRKGKYIRVHGEYEDIKRFYRRTDTIPAVQFVEYALSKLQEFLDRKNIVPEFYIDEKKGELLIIGS
jgi:hypothetical protein